MLSSPRASASFELESKEEQSSPLSALPAAPDASVDAALAWQRALTQGDLSTVATLLEKHPDWLKQLDHENRTPLHTAALHAKNSALLRYLIAQGAEIEARDAYGSTPLLLAAESGDLPSVQLLLQLGADWSRATSDGASPLFIASQQGHLPVLQCLLQSGADVRKARKDGWSPLYIASLNGHLPVLQCLLQSGADVRQVNNNGWSPLHIASRNGHLPVVQCLLQSGADVRQVNNNGWSSLHIASQNGHLPVAQCLLQSGADWKQLTGDGRSPLFVASYQGHPEVVSLLLEARADPQQKNHFGDTPLLAAVAGRPEAISLLLAARAETQGKNVRGQSALDLAAEKRDAVLFGLLLSGWFAEVSGSLVFESEERKEADYAPSKEALSRQYRKYYPVGSAVFDEDAYNGQWLTAKTADAPSTPPPLDSYSSQYVPLRTIWQGVASQAFPADTTAWPEASFFVLLPKVGKRLLALHFREEALAGATKLGNGAFGTVVRAETPSGWVALKRIDVLKVCELFHASEAEALLLAQWEVSQLEKMQHPHVVELLGIQEEPRLLAMELCDGTLDKHIETMSDAQCWSVAWDVAAGLAYVHSLGMLHRDIKLENILLKDGMAKLGDLGLAKIDPMLADSQRVEPEKLQALIGDSRWASPEEREVFRHRPTQASEMPAFLQAIDAATTAASDMYRYGLLLWCLCRKLKQPTEEARQGLGLLQHPIASLVRACLHPDPAQRPSARRVLHALEQNIPHQQPLLAKLAQRLGILAYHQEHLLHRRLEPFASLEAVQDVEAYWLRFQEGIALHKSKAPKLLTQCLQDFLDRSDSRILLLVAVGGMGKSLAAYASLQKQHKALRVFLQGKQLQCPWVPLYTNASMLQGKTCKQAFQEQYELSEEEWNCLADHPVLFILDGLDELSELPVLNALTAFPKSKLWLNSRTQPSLPMAYDVLTLLPFHQLHIADYLSQQLRWSPQEAQRFLTRLPLAPIRKVLRNPFVLSMFEALWMELRDLDWECLSQPEIYERYVALWLFSQRTHNQQGSYGVLYASLYHHLQDNHSDLAQSFTAFAGWVSARLFEKGRTQGPLDDKIPQNIALWAQRETFLLHAARRDFEEKTQKGLRSHLSLERYQELVLSSLQRDAQRPPLQWSGQGFLFMHKSIYEYTLAKACLQAALYRPETLPTLLPHRSIAEESDVTKLFATLWQQSSPQEQTQARKHLLALVDSTREHPERADLAGNALTLLNAAGEMLSHMDFRGTHIKNADLRQAVLAHSDFRFVHLCAVRLDNACLWQADFRDVQAERVCFKSETPLPFQPLGHRASVTAFSTQGDILLTADKDGGVRFWDHRGRLLKQFQERKGLRCAALHASGTFLLGDTQGEMTLHASDGKRRQRLRLFGGKSLLSLWDLGENFFVADVIGNAALYSWNHLQQCFNGFAFKPATCVCVHASTQRVVWGGAGTFRLQEASNERVRSALLYLAAHNGATTRCLSFNPQGSQVVTAADNAEMEFHSAVTGTLECTVHLDSPAWELAYTPDGQSLLLACEDKVLRVMDVETKAIVWSFAWPHRVTALHFITQDEVMVTDQDGGVSAWRLDSLTERATLLWLRAGANDTLGSAAVAPLVERHGLFAVASTPPPAQEQEATLLDSKKDKGLAL